MSKLMMLQVTFAFCASIVADKLMSLLKANGEGLPDTEGTSEVMDNVVFTFLGFLIPVAIHRFVLRWRKRKGKARKQPHDAGLKLLPLRSSKLSHSEATETSKEQHAKRVAGHVRGMSNQIAGLVRCNKDADVLTQVEGALTVIVEEANDEGPNSVEEQVIGLLRAPLNTCMQRENFQLALDMYDRVEKYISVGNINVWSILLFSAVEMCAYHRCTFFIQMMLKIRLPGMNDFVNMVRFYVHSADVAGLKKLVSDLKTRGFIMDISGKNRAISACINAGCIDAAEALVDIGTGQEMMNAISYNMLLKGHVQAGTPGYCYELYKRMRDQDVEPSEITFGRVLDALTDAKMLDRAREIFEDLKASKIKTNVVHCTSFMKCLLAHGKFDEASSLLNDMINSPTAKPNLLTYSTLVKALSEQGNVQSAIHILKIMLDQGVEADTVIFNTVLNGCCFSPQSQTMLTLKQLTDLGLRPNAPTLSIVVKALSKHQSWETALQFIDSAPAEFSIWPEARLYAQLCQACIKGGQGPIGLKCYLSFLRAACAHGTPVETSTNTWLAKLCSSSGHAVKDIACKMYQTVVKSGGHIDPSSLDLLGELVDGIQ